jgi:hypothetical protein
MYIHMYSTVHTHVNVYISLDVHIQIDVCHHVHVYVDFQLYTKPGTDMNLVMYDFY